MNNLKHNNDGITPYQQLAGLDASPLKMSDYHTFGCPAYVLDSRLQSGIGKAPKWEPRVRMGIYVGRSHAHASSVSLILNPYTGHVSPQFHVIYDDHFITVPYLRSSAVPPHWAKPVEDSFEMNRVSTQANTWQSLDVEVTPEEGDFSNIDARAIISPSKPVVTPYQIRNTRLNTAPHPSRPQARPLTPARNTSRSRAPRLSQVSSHHLIQ